MQRKFALKGLLESAGFKILVEDLSLYCQKVDNSVINRSSKPIGLDGLSNLNFELGEKSGLGIVLNLIESYKQELIDKSSNQT